MKIVAVNANGATAMKNAYDAYRDNINKKLKKMKDLKDSFYKAGFKGNQVEKIKVYANNAIDSMDGLIKVLDEFKAGIDAVMKNYSAKDTAAGNTVASHKVDVGAIEGAGDLTGVTPFGN